MRRLDLFLHSHKKKKTKHNICSNTEKGSWFLYRKSVDVIVAIVVPTTTTVVDK